MQHHLPNNIFRFLKNLKPSIQYSHFTAVPTTFNINSINNNNYKSSSSNIYSSGVSIFEGSDMSSFGYSSSSSSTINDSRSRSSQYRVELSIPLSYICDFQDIISRVGDSRDIINLYLQSIFDIYHDDNNSGDDDNSNNYITVPKNMLCPMLEAIKNWIHDDSSSSSSSSSCGKCKECMLITIDK